MPDRHVVEAFAATVESNDHVGAIERFYAPDASTRENQNEPRHGREKLAGREAAVLASVAKVETTRLFQKKRRKSWPTVFCGSSSFW